MYFFPDPQGQGSFRPTFCPAARCVGSLPADPPANRAASISLCFFRSNYFSSASIVVDGARVGIDISAGAGKEALATGGAFGTSPIGLGTTVTG